MSPAAPTPSRSSSSTARREAIERAAQTGVGARSRATPAATRCLRAVHIERATSLIVSAGRDDTSILIVLTARHLAPDAARSPSPSATSTMRTSRGRRAPTSSSTRSASPACCWRPRPHGEHVADYHRRPRHHRRARSSLREREVAAGRSRQVAARESATGSGGPPLSATAWRISALAEEAPTTGSKTGRHDPRDRVDPDV